MSCRAVALAGELMTQDFFEWEGDLPRAEIVVDYFKILGPSLERGQLYYVEGPLQSRHWLLIDAFAGK